MREALSQRQLRPVIVAVDDEQAVCIFRRQVQAHRCVEVKDPLLNEQEHRRGGKGLRCARDLEIGVYLHGITIPEEVSRGPLPEDPPVGTHTDSEYAAPGAVVAGDHHVQKVLGIQASATGDHRNALPKVPGSGRHAGYQARPDSCNGL